MPLRSSKPWSGAGYGSSVVKLVTIVIAAEHRLELIPIAVRQPRSALAKARIDSTRPIGPSPIPASIRVEPLPAERRPLVGGTAFCPGVAGGASPPPGR